MIAEYAIWRCLRAPGILRRRPPSGVIYTTPLKALSNQKYRDLCDRYGEGSIGLITGEHTVNAGAPVVVMTTEILRNVMYDEPARLDGVGDVVLDEIHFIDDYPRGTVWEEVIIEAPAHIRLIGLSATVSNIGEMAAWMSGLRGEIPTVIRTERPVALEMWLAIDNTMHRLFDDRGVVRRHTMELAQNAVAHEPRGRYSRRLPDNDLLIIIDELRRQAMVPAIYFIFSRRGCREALGRCSIHGIDMTSDVEKRTIDSVWDARAEAIDDEDERAVFESALDRETLRRGIAMHHAGMLPYAKETVEQLFQRGFIKVVFATETLALGLNMPARACVISSFTKFDGTSFASLTATQLTQLMGRAGRRGIDSIGHGVILKESDVDIRDIYDAAIADEMAVISKFAPTYTMVLNLLKSRSRAAAQELIAKSFGQYQRLRQHEQWGHREQNLRAALTDLRALRYRHPRINCTEKTLTQFLSVTATLDEEQAAIRRVKRDHWSARRRGRYGGRMADPGQRLEAMRRRVNTLQRRVDESPCRQCPHLADHRGQRWRVAETEELLASGEEELERERNRYRILFDALCSVLTVTGFVEDDRPTGLGGLAGSLFGDSSLLIAEAIDAGWLSKLSPAELAAVIAMLVGEDRGPNRPGLQGTRSPSPAVEKVGRALRHAARRLAAAEQDHGIDIARTLSYDYLTAAYEWIDGVPLMEIEVPGGADVGDVIKVMKNVYSMLRQMEQALAAHPLRDLIRRTRESAERDLIRRI